MRVFNGIRRVLLEKLKIGSYLLYALGEILLITVGVLIALYINNWNQEVSARTEEAKTLASLQENFRSNQREITGTLREYGTALRTVNLRLRHTGPGAIDPGRSVLDSISKINYVQLPYIFGGSVPALEQDKLNLLSSAVLVIELNRLPIQYNRYRQSENNVNALADRLRETHQQYVSLLTEELANFPEMAGVYTAHPADYQGWLRDRTNQNLSVETKWKVQQAMLELEQLGVDNARVLKIIGAELKAMSATE